MIEPLACGLLIMNVAGTIVTIERRLATGLPLVSRHRLSDIYDRAVLRFRRRRH